MMKNLNTMRLRACGINMCFLSITILPFSVKAQSGLNDAGFNKQDKVPGQGSNRAIRATAVQADNKILIAGNFTSYNGITANNVARLRMDGSIDKSFNSGSGVNGTIAALTIQSNNKIVVAGNFTQYNGIPVSSIIRLNSNGSLDNTFHPSLSPAASFSGIILQPDGKILAMAGNFGGGIIRLNKNGDVDPSFNPAIPDSLWFLQQIALQPDGKIILAGEETSNSLARNCGLFRLDKNGKRDYGFKNTIVSYGDYRQHISFVHVENNGNILFGSNLMIDDRVYAGNIRTVNPQGEFIGNTPLFWSSSILPTTDGKFIVTGFKYINSSLEYYILNRKIVRLNADLSVDSSFIFDDKKIYAHAVDAGILSAALQIDGKVVIAGQFFETSGLISNHIARINTDGSFDNTFNQHAGSNGTIFTSAIQGDDKIIIGGGFTRYNYQFVNNIARLKKNGELDLTFNTGSGTNGKVYTVAIQSDGKILVGGNFALYNGYACSNIIRLKKNGAIDESFGAVTNGTVRKIKMDSNGKIIISGDFRNVNGDARPVVARLLINGQLDTAFADPFSISDPSITVSGEDFAINNKGQVYLALNYQSRVFQSLHAELYRIKRNGRIDSTFSIPNNEFNEIHAVTLNNEQKPVIGGRANYSTHSSYPGFVAQLNSDGSIDNTFDYAQLKEALNYAVRSITVLQNDKLIIGGDFSPNAFSTADHIALLNSDGMMDAGFTVSASNSIYTASAVKNEKLLIGGAFSEYTGVVRNGLAQIDVTLPDEAPLRYAENIQSAVDPRIHLYPNPAQSLIHINNLTPGSFINIFNELGKKVYSLSVSNELETIELSGFPNGVYFMIVEQDGKKNTSKFIINRE
jgi:uncharacterized delta-60 repeat protein